MKKQDLILPCAVLIVILAMLSGIFYFNIIQLIDNKNKLALKVSNLTDENSQLNTLVQTMDSQINKIADEKSILDSKISIANRKLSMLDEDLNQIIKGCIIRDACYGHRGSIRFICDETGKDSDSGSHICVCDDKCELKILS
ncbi:MAG: hypothetical protein V1886_03950 [archaeon]